MKPWTEARNDNRYMKSMLWRHHVTFRQTIMDSYDIWLQYNFTCGPFYNMDQL